MANLLDYIKKYAYHTFEEKKFNDVDNLIFSALSYLDFSKLVSNKRKYKRLEEVGQSFFELYSFHEVAKKGLAQKESYKVFKKMYQTKRFKDVLLYAYEYIANSETQFCGVSFKINKNLTYIAFEGTDDLLSGWKEDFELSYKFPIASQQYATNYLNKNISFLDKEVLVGGHSKGGNLALVASMLCNVLSKRKIKKIYNNDGPGLRENEITLKRYRFIEQKIMHIVPSYSLIGVLFEYKTLKVIQSSRKDLLAHSLLTWQIKEYKLIEAELSEFSKSIHKSLQEWLNHHDVLEREKMITSFFQVLEKSGIYSLNDLKHLKKAIEVIKNLKNMDKETRTLILQFLEFNLSCLLNNYESIIK